jgi:hypothetical protein
LDLLKAARAAATQTYPIRGVGYAACKAAQNVCAVPKRLSEVTHLFRRHPPAARKPKCDGGFRPPEFLRQSGNMPARPSGMAGFAYQPCDILIAVHCTKSPPEVVSVPVLTNFQ